MPRTVLDTLIAVVLSHSLLRGSGLSTHRAQLAQLGVYRHQTFALQSLREELSRPENQSSDILIVCVMMALMSEVCPIIMSPLGVFAVGANDPSSNARHSTIGGCMQMGCGGLLGSGVVSKQSLDMIIVWMFFYDIS